MTTFVLVPGAASDPSYWRFVRGELERDGHDVIAVDLPCEDDSAGLSEYVEAVVRAVGDSRDIVLVAHSLGAFTATLACQRLSVELLVLVSAMIPAPGESGDDWWTNTGHHEAYRAAAERVGFDPDDEVAFFYNGVDPDIVAAEVARDQSSTPMQQPWPLTAWPDVPTRFVLFRDDRLFPADFVRRLVHDRLGIEPDEIDGGHMAMLSHPRELADLLERYSTGS